MQSVAARRQIASRGSRTSRGLRPRSRGARHPSLAKARSRGARLLPRLLRETSRAANWARRHRKTSSRADGERPGGGTELDRASRYTGAPHEQVGVHWPGPSPPGCRLDCGRCSFPGRRIRPGPAGAGGDGGDRSSHRGGGGLGARPDRRAAHRHRRAIPVASGSGRAVRGADRPAGRPVHEALPGDVDSRGRAGDDPRPADRRGEC